MVIFAWKSLRAIGHQRSKDQRQKMSSGSTSKRIREGRSQSCCTSAITVDDKLNSHQLLLLSPINTPASHWFNTFHSMSRARNGHRYTVGQPVSQPAISRLAHFIHNWLLNFLIPISISTRLHIITTTHSTSARLDVWLKNPNRKRKKKICWPRHSHARSNRRCRCDNVGDNDDCPRSAVGLVLLCSTTWSAAALFWQFTSINFNPNK